MKEKEYKIAKDSIYDYLKWRGDLSFEQDKFNEVDSFIFTQLIYYNFEGIVLEEPILLKEALKHYYETNNSRKFKIGLIIPKHIFDLGKTVIKCKRYANVYVSDFVDIYDRVKKEQFCAITFHLDHYHKVITFQGTDDTLVGWEEDLNMIISFPIAAQISASKYVEEVYNKYSNAIFELNGHSKGGNLAMYSGIYASEEIKNKIYKIYNFDGPGFEACDIDLVLYSKMKNKIKTILPCNSVIGMIFNQLGTVKAVKSTFKTVFQHDGFTWEIDGNKFIRSTLSKNSISFSKDLNELVGKLDEEARLAFCKSVEKYIDSLGIKSLLELSSLKTKPLSSLKIFTKYDRSLFIEFVKILIKNKII